MFHALSMKFQLLTTLMLKNSFLLLNFQMLLFILLINAKMPAIVGILTFLNLINFIISGPGIVFAFYAIRTLAEESIIISINQSDHHIFKLATNNRWTCTLKRKACIRFVKLRIKSEYGMYVPACNDKRVNRTVIMELITCIC